MGNKKYKDEHKKKGLCVDCSRPAIVGKIRCLKCTEKFRIYDNKRSKKRRETRKDENKCVTCSSPLLEIDIKDGYVNCCNCRQRIHRTQGFPYYIGKE